MTQAPLRTNRSVSRVRKKKEKGRGRSGETVQAPISAEARRLQKRAGVLAERGDELRAEKVRRIKEQVVHQSADERFSRRILTGPHAQLVFPNRQRATNLHQLLERDDADRQ